MEIAVVSWTFDIGYLLFSNLAVNHKENKTTFGVSFHVLQVMIYFKLFDLLKLIICTGSLPALTSPIH
jgi:hypothetical protein